MKSLVISWLFPLLVILPPAAVHAQTILADESDTTLPTADTPTAAEPQTQPTAVNQPLETADEYRLSDFLNHFAPYQPIYAVGWPTPNFEIQISMRYQLLTPTGPLAKKYPLLNGINLAYTQQIHGQDIVHTGFFYDINYCPDAFYDLKYLLPPSSPNCWHFDAQVGVDHESNGEKSPDHRALNVVYIRPILDVGQAKGWFFTFAPKIYDYVGSLSLNPDMPFYRGYCDLRLVVGRRDGLQLATIGRVGSHFNRGSAQLDLTYPLTKISRHNLDFLVDAQYFVGYGDTLRTYNQRTSIFRIGVAFVR
jgi:phospholipase A1/A2